MAFVISRDSCLPVSPHVLSNVMNQGWRSTYEPWFFFKYLLLLQNLDWIGFWVLLVSDCCFYWGSLLVAGKKDICFLVYCFFYIYLVLWPTPNLVRWLFCLCVFCLGLLTLRMSTCLQSTCLVHTVVVDWEQKMFQGKNGGIFKIQQYTSVALSFSSLKSD